MSVSVAVALVRLLIDDKAATSYGSVCLVVLTLKTEDVSWVVGHWIRNTDHLLM